MTISNVDLDPEDLSILSNHLAPGSSSGYGYTWVKFSKFCNTRKVDPFSCPPSIIVKYLRAMYEDGAQYRTVNHARCAISKLHNGFQGMPVEQHVLVKQAVKSVFRLRPPLPKYKHTYDINKVLVYIRQILGNNKFLPLRLLSMKCLFLTCFSSISRVSTLSHLGAAVEEYQDHIIVPILVLEKQARGET